MFFCRNCGQSPHLSDDNFIEVRYTSGWESNWCDPHDGDYVDYIDGEQTESSHDTYECPTCSSNNIETEWEGTEEEAQEVRDNYNVVSAERRRVNNEEYAQRQLEQKAKDPSRQWDVDTNVTL